MFCDCAHGTVQYTRVMFKSLALASALLAAPAFAGATIEGTVAIQIESRPPASSGRYQIKTSTAVAPPDPVQAVVYLEGDFPKASGTNLAVATMPQKHYQFAPGVLPVQKGATVQFPNQDDDYHNVFSYSKAKRFDLGRYRKDENPPSQVFDKPGLVKLYCEIHEHMRGSILVLDTPYFAAANRTNGAYRLTNLPAGKFTLKAWVDEKIVEKPVELKDGETITVDFK